MDVYLLAAGLLLAALEAQGVQSLGALAQRIEASNKWLLTAVGRGLLCSLTAL
jgi:hypothetical protein